MLNYGWTLNDLLGELALRGIDGIGLNDAEVNAVLGASSAEDAAERIRVAREL